MISEDTFRDLQHFAENGVLRTRIAEFYADDPNPVAGNEVTLRWNFANGISDLGTLHVLGQPRILVAPVGIHSVRVGPTPLTVNLRVGSESVDIHIVPRMLKPKITRFRCLGKAITGEAVIVRWKTIDAVRCVLKVQEGGHTIEHEVAPSGSFEVHPSNTGTMDLFLTAFGNDAELFEDAIASAETNVEVGYAPIKISMQQTIKRGRIGEEVAFGWVVINANSVVLEALDRREVWTVPACAEMRVEVDCQSEKFCLHATNDHGDEKKVMFELIPDLLSELSQPCTLPTLRN